MSKKITSEIAQFIATHPNASSRKISSMIKTHFGTSIGKTTLVNYRRKKNQNTEVLSHPLVQEERYLLRPHLYFDIIRPLHFNLMQGDYMQYYGEYELPEKSAKDDLIFALEHLDTQLYLHFHGLTLLPSLELTDEQLDRWHTAHPEVDETIIPCCYPVYARGLLFNHPNEVDVPVEWFLEREYLAFEKLCAEGWQ
jgi:hypothetical protein